MRAVNKRALRKVAGALPCIVCMAAIGCCASRAPRSAAQIHTEHDAPLAPGEPQIERGRPAPVIDAVGWVMGVPAKILMFDRRVSNHNVSPETEAAIGRYLADNNLDKVKVRLNEYDPGGEWRRLRENQSVSWPIRYSLGTLSVVGYTLLPGRIFGGDRYNPYTNSVYLYSDVPALGVYQGGYAKEFAIRESRDLYAVSYALPFVNAWHATEAANESLDYLGERGSQDLEDGYRSICPACTAKVAPVVVGGVPLTLPAIAAGHAVGQVRAAEVGDAQVQPASANLPQEPRYGEGNPGENSRLPPEGVSAPR